ncbi:MraY family glycosyltransferase [Microbacterium sp. 11MF]|uniref:MraY family glycosyltransferase n=1 Tax=Microbacterium sp. 11MF TaxID=1169146 RepID=UPI0003633B57|nr:MraY family glycosyltransferase [Microbacterium sp. 11MF]
MRDYLLAFVITGALTFVFSWVVWRVAMRFGLHPAIRERDVHKTPTPRLGGVAMFIGMLGFFVLSSQLPAFAIVWQEPSMVWSLLGAAALMVVVGVADDLWDLDWMIKLGAQFVAAWIVVFLGGIQIFYLPFGQQVVVSSWVSISLSILLIVIVMNAVNFIDGLDGLVAGVCLIANAVFFAYSAMLVRDFDNSEQSNTGVFIAIVLLGMCAGFLPFNWNPARMFMGDAGALLLGLMMASSAIVVTGNLPPNLLSDNDLFGRSQLLGAFIPVILPVVIVLLPLVDFGLAVVRRMAQGKSPFSPDRKHLHHRMLDMGHTDRNAVFVFYAWTAVVSLSVLLMYIGTTKGWPGRYWPGVAFLIIGCVACVLVTLPPARPARPVAPERKALS